MKIDIQRTVEVDDLFAQDILVTAIEGGSTYWLNEDDITDVELVRYPKERNKDGYYYKALKFTADDKTYEVAEAGICETLRQIARFEYYEGGTKYGRFSAHPTHLDSIIDALSDNDAGQIDANLADIILQLTCFGQLVYG